MNRLEQTFHMLRDYRKRALIPFVMSGDRSLRQTERLMAICDQSGADVIELGMPFSDPLADGPTIQAAAQRGLRTHIRLQQVLRSVHTFRRGSDRPVVLLSYINPLIAFGGFTMPETTVGTACEPFLCAAAQAGLDGVVIPDLPVDESGTLRMAAQRHGITLIPLVAPTSSTQRVRTIAKTSRGFIYYVSVTGTTGVRRRLTKDVVQGIQRVTRLTSQPVCVGFGISTAEQAARVARIADGVIVGSALVRCWDRTRSVRAVERFVRTFRRAIDSAC
jgi:tryptophan synthase alpha chain